MTGGWLIALVSVSTGISFLINQFQPPPNGRIVWLMES